MKWWNCSIWLILGDLKAINLTIVANMFIVQINGDKIFGFVLLLICNLVNIFIYALVCFAANANQQRIFLF